MFSSACLGCLCQVGQKLQCVLRANPKKSRPSLRKLNGALSKAPKKKKHVIQVWEVESESEAEVLPISTMATSAPSGSSSVDAVSRLRN